MLVGMVMIALVGVHVLGSQDAVFVFMMVVAMAHGSDTMLMAVIVVMLMVVVALVMMMVKGIGFSHGYPKANGADYSQGG
jgi:hypothetical protein